MGTSNEHLLLAAREEIVRWGKHERGLGDNQVGFLLELLNKEVLLSLPCSSKVEKHDTPEGLRHLFYHQVSNILGWKERVPEGHKFGISPQLYSLVRQIWPSQQDANNEESLNTNFSRDGGRRSQQHSSEKTLASTLLSI